MVVTYFCREKWLLFSFISLHSGKEKGNFFNSLGTQMIKTVVGFHEIDMGLLCIVHVIVKSVIHWEQIRHDKRLISQCTCFTFCALHYIAGPVDKTKHIYLHKSKDKYKKKCNNLYATYTFLAVLLLIWQNVILIKKHIQGSYRILSIIFPEFLMISTQFSPSFFIKIDIFFPESVVCKLHEV